MDFINVFAIKVKYGLLVMYGEDVDMCKNYIKKIVNCVEDVYEYCDNRKILIYYMPYGNKLLSIYEKIRINRIAKKYHSKGTQKDLYDFIEKYNDIKIY